MIRVFIVVLSIFGVVNASAQTRSLGEMMERLVDVNFELIKSGMNVDKAQLGVTPAPFLPSLGASAVQQQKITSQAANTLSAGASLSWRLFDGGGMFYKYWASKESLKAEQLRMFANVEDLSSSLVSRYNYVISLESRLDVAHQSVKLSRERYAEALSKYNIGAGSGLEMRLAKTDLNADSTTLVKSREALDIAYLDLNEMLRYELTDRGYVNDTIVVEHSLNHDSLKASTVERNTQILISRSGEALSELDLKTARSERYPTLDFGAAYNLGLRNDSPAQKFNSYQDGTWGLSVGVTLFNGMEISRKIRTAKIDRDIAAVNGEQIVHEILSAFERTWLNYQNNLQLIDFERENAAAMALNLTVAIERYRLGDLSGIDFRNIQLQFLAAQERKIATIYQAKLSEIELLILSGQLL